MDNNPEASSAHSDPRHHPENHHHHHSTMAGEGGGGDFSPHPQEQQPGYPYHVHADAAHDPAPEEEDAPSSPSKRSHIHMEEEEESAHHPSTIQQAQATTATASSTISSTASPTKKQRTQRQQQRTPWEERLAQLQAYKDEHGHLEIPIRYKPNPSLGKFVHNTREQYKVYLRLQQQQQQPQDAVAGATTSKPKKCPLTSERVAQLEALGFVFSAGRTEQQEQGWQSRLQQLKEYKEEHGDCFVPHKYSKDPSLSEWVHRQRVKYVEFQKWKNQGTASAPVSKKKKSFADPELLEARFQKLQEIGFPFTVQLGKWMDNWNMLKEFKEKNGHCVVPTHWPENPRLGRWVHTQRHHRRILERGTQPENSSMTQERIALLDQLGFAWEVKPQSHDRFAAATWEQRLEELTEFVQEHGHFRVDPETLPQLHAWMVEQKQRMEFFDRTDGYAGEDDPTSDPYFITGERVAALKSIGFNSDTEVDLHETSTDVLGV